MPVLPPKRLLDSQYALVFLSMKSNEALSSEACANKLCQRDVLHPLSLTCSTHLAEALSYSYVPLHLVSGLLPLTRCLLPQTSYAKDSEGGP